MARLKPTRPAVQPGAGGTIQPEAMVKTSLYLEQQKFKDTKRTRQLTLRETGLDGRELEEAVEASGLDLSVSEQTALHALGMLWSRTGYQGNRPGQELEMVESFKWSGVLPVLSFTRSEFFEAYGLERKRDGSYHGHQVEEALKALRSLLTDRRRLCFTRTTWSGKGQSRKAKREAVVYTAPLATIRETYRDLSEEEQQALHQGEDIPRRSTSIEVILGPMFVDGLDHFYSLKPAAMLKELQAARRPKRVRKVDILFLNWLQTWNKPEVSIAKDKLLERLRLDGYIKRRRRKEAEVILQEVIDTALQLGYLLSYQEKPGQWSEPVLHFRLNPERIGRLKAKAEASDG